MTQAPPDPPGIEPTPPPEAPAPAPAVREASGGTAWRPPYVFFAVVSIVTLAADLGTKWWAERRLPVPKDVSGSLSFVLTHNPGGAWGILQNQPEAIRKPFFFGVSALAIGFIVSLYRKLAPQQRALRWGLPLVLGGALGNLVDRIRYGKVVDFIDYHAGWVGALNRLFGNRTDHWPTFNVADVAICVGIGLMAIDMLSSRRPAQAPSDAASHG